jgi:hypothetical protein
MLHLEWQETPHNDSTKDRVMPKLIANDNKVDFFFPSTPLSLMVEFQLDTRQQPKHKKLWIATQKLSRAN